MNFDGLIVECHCHPENALSDSAQQITPDVLAYILDTLVIPSETTSTESLGLLRKQIDRLDDELLELLAKRMRVARDIGRYKKEHNMPVLQPGRYNDLMQKRVDAAVQLDLNADFIKNVLASIHEESVRQQIELQ